MKRTRLFAPERLRAMFYRIAPGVEGQPRDRWPVHVAVLLGFLLLGVLATWPLALNVLSAVPGSDNPITRGGMADQDQGLWAHWWLAETLLHRHGSLLSTDLLYWPYYRDGLSLLLYELQLGRSLLALPLQLTLGLAAAYNFSIFVSFALGGYGVFLLARDRGLSRPAALLAGIIFVAGPYHIMQLFWETALFAVEALPFALLWCWRAVRDGRPGALLLAGACLAWANLSSWYFIFYVLVALALLVLGYSWRRRKEGWRGVGMVFGRGAMIGVIYALLYSPLLVPLLSTLGGSSAESRVFLNIMSIRGASMHWYNLFSNRHDPSLQTTFWHNTSFLGYSAIVLALVGIVRQLRRAWPWLALFFVYLNLAMGPDLHGFGDVVLANGEPVPLPYYYLLQLPGMNLIRAPAHANQMLLLCTGMLVGLGFDALARPLAARLFPQQAPPRVALRGLLAAMVTVLLLSEYLILPLPLYTLSWPAIYTQIGQDDGDYGIMELPVTAHASNDHHRMFNQIAHHKAIAGGYLPRAIPDPYRAADSPLAMFTQAYTATEVLAQDWDEASRALLELYDFRYLSVYHDHKDYRVDNSPWEWPLDTPLYSDDDITVYPVRPAQLDRTYLYLGGTWAAPEIDAGGMRRPMSDDTGYVLVWSPGGSGKLALTLEGGIGSGIHQLEFALDGARLQVEQLDAATGPRELLTGPLTLARGWHSFRVTDLAPVNDRGYLVYLRHATWQPGE